MPRRHGELIGIGGFTPGVATQLQQAANDAQLVLLIDRPALTAWIDTSDRVEWIKLRLRDAVLRTHPQRA